MNRLAGIINAMNYKELKEIQKDLAEGNIGRLIKARLDQIEKTIGYEKVCPTCDSKISEDTAKYTLMFGPADFRKKASFCGLDCLTFFAGRLRVAHKGEEKHI
jgi:hypothetical protein